MARKLKFDRWLFLTTLVLLAVSIVMVYSATSLMGAGTEARPNAFPLKQAVFAAAGLLAMLAAMRIDYQRYREPRLILGLTGLTIVALVAVRLVGPEINGTHRWFAVGGVGIQPSELAKLAIILFTAAVLERRMDRIGEPTYALGPVVAVLAPMVALILWQPDFGSAVALLAIVAVMVFAAGLPWRWSWAPFRLTTWSRPLPKNCTCWRRATLLRSPCRAPRSGWRNRNTRRRAPLLIMGACWRWQATSTRAQPGVATCSS